MYNDKPSTQIKAESTASTSTDPKLALKREVVRSFRVRSAVQTGRWITSTGP
jgi:hypothetical protein